jgi:hypothetical protein
MLWPQIAMAIHDSPCFDAGDEGCFVFREKTSLSQVYTA